MIWTYGTLVIFSDELNRLESFWKWGNALNPHRKFHENRKNWAEICYATSMRFHLKPRHTMGNLTLLNMSLALLPVNGYGAPIRLCGHNSCRNSVQFHLQKLYIWQFSGHGEIP